jgi:dTDP-4-dehydrorhamnose reductase
VIALDRHGLDLANPDSIRRAVREHKPNLIVNTAAYTAVDKAEEESDLAMAINGIAPGIFAEEASRLNAAMVHYSTDYVFDGMKDGPYAEDDLPNPLNVYGKTKLAGERAIQVVGVPHLIFRTSWVYGARRKNFLLTMLRLTKERDEIRVVDDQIGAPTWCRMIAEATALALARLALSERGNWDEGVTGTYHMTAAGETTWYGFTKEIIVKHGPCENGTKSLKPVKTGEYPAIASRPKNSVLSNDKLLRSIGVQLPDWRKGVELCLEEVACSNQDAALAVKQNVVSASTKNKK